MNRAADYLPGPAPTVAMPRNQFEPWLRVAERYKRITGITPDLMALMLAASGEHLALCPERRREPNGAAEMPDDDPAGNA